MNGLTDVRLVGVDLAWGERARTGVAVADSAGRLVASATLHLDGEIVEFVESHAPNDAVVAIDAPLIVRNPASRRRCEALVQQAFGRYGAGPYPSNLANPAFANGTRGARLCQRLDLDMDPASRSARRAIEVYPHPAMVVLLNLAYVIPYKNKRGRTVDSLKAAFAQLMSAMEEVLAELQLAKSASWATLRGIASSAATKSQLDGIEDEVDAIFCAHLAFLWQRYGEERNRVYGDFDSGYIVVPETTAPLPEPRRPSPKLTADRHAQLARAIQDAVPRLSSDEIEAIVSAVMRT